MTLPAPQPNEGDLELLSAYIDHELSDGEQAALERRLEAEPALRRELGELRATVAAVRDLEPARPPRSFTIDAARARELRRPGGWRSWLPMLQAGGALATVVVLALAWSALGARVGGTGGGAPAAQVAAAPTAPQGFSIATDAGDSPAGAAREAAPTSAPAATSAPPMAAALPAPESTSAPEATSAPAAGSAGSTAAQASTPETMAAEAPAPPATAADTGNAAGAAQPAPGASEKTAQSTATPPGAGLASEVATPANAAPETTDLAPPDSQPAAARQPSMALIIAAGALLLVAAGVAGVVVARRRR